MPTMRMRFASILITDEEQSLDFYVNKLGFKLVVDNPLPWGGRFLMLAPTDGGTKLVMSKPLPNRPDAQPGGFSNIAWECDDVDAIYEELRAKGVTFTQPPTRSAWGGVEAIFADPDGNTFLLQQGHMG
jgi:lactoylglutathione lyase